MSTKKITLCCAGLVVNVVVSIFAAAEVPLLKDGFQDLPAGLLFDVVGAELEYHYLPIARPKGPWYVSTFRSEPESQRAWRVLRADGVTRMAQTYVSKSKDCHPMLVAGDSLWSDYSVEVRFVPRSTTGRTGVGFRYRNDRRYYFFGLEKKRLVLLRIDDGKEFREPIEETLAETDYAWEPGKESTARVSVQGREIKAGLAGGPSLTASDDAYPVGRVAILSDGPAEFLSVTVGAEPEAAAKIQAAIAKRDGEERRLQFENPKPVLWKKFSIRDYGVGRNLRFGDLDNDGQIDVLFGQIVHHGPKDRASELSCLTAVTFDGKVLWQTGEPDPWKTHLSNDVAFQIHDLDGDGRNEAIYCMNAELVVADGATGAVKRKVPTPPIPENTPPPYNQTPRLLGDSMLFCDLRGTGRPADILLKDRYTNYWALNDSLEILWQGQCNTGHYPFACDVDHDGKDEVMMGYSLIDHDGKVLWSLDDQLKDHDDGVAIVRFREDQEPRVFCAASDEGMFLADLRGNILEHLYLGHVQNPGIADFRPDLPGLETITVNFWGSQGIIHCYDADGKVYHDFEPFQHGSLCLPVNWTGRAGEYVLLSANVEDGGLFDGWGRRVVTFPADGHPDLCYAVLDLTGDARDEIVVWDPYEVWVYTQDDSPKSGKLYKPARSPLYNYSNYQATVSLPGWTE